jgi:ABC-2 type transport system permease protein
VHFLRVVMSTARYNLITTFRVFRITSYALRFFMPLLSIGTAWILYHRAFHGEVSSEFGQFAYTDYLTFVIVGNAAFVYIYASVFYTGRAFFFSRLEGVLDPLFLTPMSRFGFMVGSALVGMINATFDFVILIVIGLVFGMNVSSFSFLLFFTGLVMTLVALFGLGLVVNGVTLSLRDRTNVSNLLQTLLYTFSGVVVPVEMMPGWAQAISRVSPLTYGLRIIRGSFRSGVGLSGFYEEILILTGMSLVMLVIGSFCLGAIEKNLKKNARLTVL